MTTKDGPATTSTIELLVATGNRGKIRELQELLGGLPVALKGLDDFSGVEEVAETGETFAENAILKAAGYARQTGRWALSDDSGLAVDALGGAPGVYSARYGGEGLSDAERIDRLLGALGAAGDGDRRARFVCAMAVADPSGEIRFLAEGVCEGVITEVPRGTNGFGYDPIFVPEGHAQTFGELSSAIKRQISHRARAISKIMAFFRDFTGL